MHNIFPGIVLTLLSLVKKNTRGYFGIQAGDPDDPSDAKELLRQDGFSM